MSFNSQLSGDLSVAQAGASSGRKTQPASGRGIIEFLVGSKRSNYSTPVYLFVVFLVSVVLWGVMPWIISAYADLNLEDRIARLEQRPAGSGEGISDATMAELKKMQTDVAAQLAEMKDLQSQVGKTIDQFNAQAEYSSQANSGDLSGVQTDLTNLKNKLNGMSEATDKYDGSIASIEGKLTVVEGKVDELGTTKASLESKIGENTEGIQGASSRINTLEQAIKDTNYNLDGVVSTIASKCTGYAPAGADGKAEQPNFALGCAGAKVEDVAYPTTGLAFSDMLKSSVYRYTGVNFDHDNPYYNVLDSSNEPGQCWCFPGQQANITVHLITPMVPTEFFVHHIFMEYYTETKIDLRTAAPKDFTVIGIDGDGEHVLGDYSYDAAGQREKGLEQVFPVHQNQGKVFELVKVVFRESSWNASRKYTCVYQFGVHGTGTLPLD